MATDITMHSDKELSLIVFNEPYYYNELWNPDFIIALVREDYIFTNDQLEVLVRDLDAHHKEVRRYSRALAQGETS